MFHPVNKTIPALDNKIIQANQYLSSMLPKGWAASLVIESLENQTYELSFCDESKTLVLKDKFLAILTPLTKNKVDLVCVQRLNPRITRNIFKAVMDKHIKSECLYYADMIEYHLDS